MEKYDKLYLEKLGIYDLRTVARDVGVKSPTTKRHSDLVDCILKIQNGEEQISQSKKGRPPKKLSLNTSALIDIEKVEGGVTSFNYVEEKLGGLVFCSNDDISCINQKYYDCAGVIRNFDGKNYICDGSKYTIVNDEILEKNQLKIGDYVIGKAYEVSFRVGFLDKVEDINFSKIETYTGNNDKKFEIHEIKNISDIYNKIKNQKDKEIKIVVELEVEDYSVITLNDCVYFYSKELDDVKKSFNTLVDCLKLVKTLSETNKPFSLYLIDVDYIYNILRVHLSSSTSDNKDIDAGQFIKMLLSYVKNSVGGNALIYENKKYKRNEYLDAILNKYL